MTVTRAQEAALQRAARSHDDDVHREMAIAALSPEMQAAMATWALKGYRFVYFSVNEPSRQWKALDYPDGVVREVHTAATLYVLLSALGKPS